MLDRIRTLRCLAGNARRALWRARDGADAVWHVGKSSGEVWLTGAGVQQVSLGGDTVLKPGDTIRTGRNGRVLLVRGEETILISPNSVIGIPAAPKDGLSTTIIQQAGSILLEVEKRNVKHFEVETPYLRRRGEGHPVPRLGRQERLPASMCSAGRSRWRISSPASSRWCLPGQVAKVLARSVGGLLAERLPATLSPILKGDAAYAGGEAGAGAEGWPHGPDRCAERNNRSVWRRGRREPRPFTAPAAHRRAVRPASIRPRATRRPSRYAFVPDRSQSG